MFSMSRKQKQILIGLALVIAGWAIQLTAHAIAKDQPLDTFARWTGVITGAFGIFLALSQILWGKKS